MSLRWARDAKRVAYWKEVVSVDETMEQSYQGGRWARGRLVYGDGWWRELQMLQGAV